MRATCLFTLAAQINANSCSIVAVSPPESFRASASSSPESLTVLQAMGSHLPTRGLLLAIRFPISNTSAEISLGLGLGLRLGLELWLGLGLGLGFGGYG